MEPNPDPEHQLMIDHRTSQAIEIDPRRARFPRCIVWTPLPVISWLVPFIGHMGICREDGVILDFAGPNFVCVDNFTFGAVARYIQISEENCRICPNSAAYKSEEGYRQDEPSRDLFTWDDALRKGTQEFQHRAYNLFTCNCHSFVANNLNRLAFRSGGWNVVNVAALIFLKGKWVNKASMVRSYLPFVVVFGLGITIGGWTFITFLAFFAFLLVGWFLFANIPYGVPSPLVANLVYNILLRQREEHHHMQIALSQKKAAMELYQLFERSGCNDENIGNWRYKGKCSQDEGDKDEDGAGDEGGCSLFSCLGEEMNLFREKIVLIS